MAPKLAPEEVAERKASRDAKYWEVYFWSDSEKSMKIVEMHIFYDLISSELRM